MLVVTVFVSVMVVCQELLRGRNLVFPSPGELLFARKAAAMAPTLVGTSATTAMMLTRKGAPKNPWQLESAWECRPAKEGSSRVRNRRQAAETKDALKTPSWFAGYSFPGDPLLIAGGQYAIPRSKVKGFTFYRFPILALPRDGDLVRRPG